MTEHLPAAGNGGGGPAPPQPKLLLRLTFWEVIPTRCLLYKERPFSPWHNTLRALGETSQVILSAPLGLDRSRLPRLPLAPSLAHKMACPALQQPSSPGHPRSVLSLGRSSAPSSPCSYLAPAGSSPNFGITRRQKVQLPLMSVGLPFTLLQCLLP